MTEQYKWLYYDKGFTPYDVDLDRYKLYKTLPYNHRNALGEIGQKFERKCHKLTKAGSFELVMVMSEFLDRERE